MTCAPTNVCPNTNERAVAVKNYTIALGGALALATAGCPGILNGQPTNEADSAGGPTRETAIAPPETVQETAEWPTVASWPVGAGVTWFLATPYDGIALEVQKEAIAEAFRLWTNDTKLVISEAEDTASADIVLGFGPTQHCGLYESVNRPCGDTFGPETLAHAYFPPPAGGRTPGDVHFNSDKVWTLFGDRTSVGLTKVALHEIGHALGIDDAPAGADSVMAARYSSNAVAPTESDVRTIQSLYGERTRTEPAVTIDNEDIESTEFALVTQGRRVTVENWEGLPWPNVTFSA